MKSTKLDTDFLCSTVDLLKEEVSTLKKQVSKLEKENSRLRIGKSNSERDANKAASIIASFNTIKYEVRDILGNCTHECTYVEPDYR
jgi:hypothetical protein